MAWLVEHAADVLNRYGIGKDGRTPYQRLKGRKFMGNMLKFRAPVMFRISGKVAGGIMQERWFAGIWVGKKLHTDEHLVMKEDGLVVDQSVAHPGGLRQAEEHPARPAGHDPFRNYVLEAARSKFSVQISSLFSISSTEDLRDDKEEVLDYRPRRAKLTKDVVEK
jgi:hypothetical protein